MERNIWQCCSNITELKYYVKEFVSGIDFLFADEQFYTFSQGETTAQQQAERLLFREVAAAVARQQLESEAINEIARDLKAAFAEQDMERLIESFSHYLKQDDWYR